MECLLHWEGSTGQFPSVGVKESQLQAAQSGQANLIFDANYFHQFLLLIAQKTGQVMKFTQTVSSATGHFSGFSVSSLRRDYISHITSNITRNMQWVSAMHQRPLSAQIAISASTKIKIPCNEPLLWSRFSHWQFNTIGTENAEIILLTGRFWRQKRDLGKTRQ